jgi:2-polyprenyl-3-methyl-5-hydroxy-6-metoxy-1,4-benzoquinol methylase
MDRLETPCDNCGSRTLDAVYVPQNSHRKARVCVCATCGLTQSLYSAASRPKDASTSADAGWGNIRYGKGMHLKRHAPLLDALLDRRPSAILDIGSNRGAFISYLLDKEADWSITAVEPDTSVTQTYSGDSRVHFIPGLLEDCRFPDASFDFIYSSHTLEHADSAARMLATTAAALREQGLLFLAVPNLACIENRCIAEEFFIDKHSFHFDRDVLTGMFAAAGLRVREEHNTETELLFIAEKAPARMPQPGNAYAANVRRIAAYTTVLAKNRAALGGIAGRIEAFAAEGPVIVWGAGRIFNNLAGTGGLDASRLSLVVDTNLPRYVRELACGVRVDFPDALGAFDGTTARVVILSREYAEEIREECEKRGFSRTVTFDELQTACLSGQRS